ACEGKGIFEGIRKDVWKCGNFCKSDVCVLKTSAGKKYDQIILIRALFKRWLEYFLDDYNKIKHRISHCTKNGNQPICTSDCGEKCNCVKEWIGKKRAEWEEIKKRFFNQYKIKDSDKVFEVKSFLQQQPFNRDFNKAIKPCPTLDAFEKSKQCNATASSEKGKDGNKSYVIDCLLQELEK
ncbi:hypothetical protein K1I93_09690, partial [Streptococcus australis]|nr:hypothetical protein [Streptococcus australis]